MSKWIDKSYEWIIKDKVTGEVLDRGRAIADNTKELIDYHIRPAREALHKTPEEITLSIKERD